MMEWYYAFAFIIGGFMLLVFMGIPINFALGLSFFPLLYFFSSETLNYTFNLFGLVTFRKLNNIALVATPLFILMGQIFGTTSTGARMYEGFQRWLGWIPGGLAVSTIATNTLFAAICGASVISAGTTGPISIPSMVGHGYNKRLALGAECAGSALSMLIPPSIPMIFYCLITDQSIGHVFMAGIIPGLILSVLFIGIIIIRVKRDPSLAPYVKMAPREQRYESIPWIAGPLGIIVLILISLYSGIADVNEMAAIGLLGALILALVYRELNWRVLVEATLKATRFHGFFAMVFVCACFMGFGFTYFGIGEAASQWIVGLEVPRVVILIILMVMYLLLGMIMDASALILVTMPFVLPIITALGYDPVWFGVLLILNLEVGAITPPVGVNLFALKSAMPEVDLKDAIFGSVPFVFMIFILMGLLIIVPDLALWLPSTMMG